MADPRISVLVVDEHDFYRAAMVAGLSTDTRIVLIGQTASGVEALHRLAADRPQCVLVEDRVVDSTGGSWVRAATMTAVPARIIALASVPSRLAAAVVVDVGATGYISKSRRRADVVAALVRVVSGEVVVAL